MIHADTQSYNEARAPGDRAICQLLAEQIDRGLPDAENRIWHAHPVWFLDANPIVGYSKLKGQRAPALLERPVVKGGRLEEGGELQGRGG